MFAFYFVISYLLLDSSRSPSVQSIEAADESRDALHITFSVIHFTSFNMLYVFFCLLIHIRLGCDVSYVQRFERGACAMFAF